MSCLACQLCHSHPFDLPAVRRKTLTVDFEGGNQSSNGAGVGA